MRLNKPIDLIIFLWMGGYLLFLGSVLKLAFYIQRTYFWEGL